VDEHLAPGVIERELLPVLSVGAELQPGVSCGCVVLDVQIVLLEPDRFGRRRSATA
jgi:hypothetical protein